MMRKLTAFVLGLAIVAFSGGAFAQKGGKGKDGYDKVKKYDFSGDDIEGELVKPEGDFLTERPIAKKSSLIRVREDFIREIVKSAEDL
jgi:hypothetical protein